MLEKVCNKFLGLAWFRRSLVVTILVFTYWLTDWAARFAALALDQKADLVGTAGIIAAVSAVPLGLLTLLSNNYIEKREKDGP